MQEAAAQELLELTTANSHLKAEIKKLEITVSDLRIELESKELTKVDVWKENADDIETGRLAEYTSVLKSKPAPKDSEASKRYCKGHCMCKAYLPCDACCCPNTC